jgi:hypothetical protein
VRTDWDAWNKRDLADEDIVRLILDGTVVRVRLDKKATNISLLVVLGVRRDGQKVLLAVKNMGGESEAAWRATLDGLIGRGLRTPEFLITDGGAGLERALAALWPDVPAQRCTVHKHRNPAETLLSAWAHAPDALHGRAAKLIDGTADYRHDLRRNREGGAGQAQSVPAQVAPAVPGGRHQPGGADSNVSRPGIPI